VLLIRFSTIKINRVPIYTVSVQTL